MRKGNYFEELQIDGDGKHASELGLFHVLRSVRSVWENLFSGAIKDNFRWSRLDGLCHERGKKIIRQKKIMRYIVRSLTFILSRIVAVMT